MNIVPQSLQSRQAEMHREDLEKMRLRNRREKFAHYEVRERTALCTPRCLAHPVCTPGVSHGPQLPCALCGRLFPPSLPSL